MLKALKLILTAAFVLSLLWASGISNGGGGGHVIGFTLDGGGAVIATGDMKTYPVIPGSTQGGFSCTIYNASISADQSGSVTVDVWKANGAVPTAANKISASAPITLSGAQVNATTTLTGWTTSVVPGDVFGFSVATAATVQRITGQIWCR